MNVSKRIDIDGEFRTCGLVSGDLRVFPIANVLQFLGVSRVTGMLRLASGGERGMIWFDRGAIVAASLLSRIFQDRARSPALDLAASTDEAREALLSARAAEVISSVMAWSEGHFSFDGYRLAPTDQPRPRLEVDHALMLSAWRHDESSRTEPKSVDAAPVEAAPVEAAPVERPRQSE